MLKGRDFDGTTRGPVRGSGAACYREREAKRPAGSGERGPRRTFEAGEGLREKIVCRCHWQQVPASRTGHRQLARQHGREALVGMTMIPVEGLDARIGRPRLGVGIRRRFVIMHVMAEVPAMLGQPGYAGVTSGFQRVAHVRPCRIRGIENETEREEKCDEQTHDGADSSRRRETAQRLSSVGCRGRSVLRPGAPFAPALRQRPERKSPRPCADSATDRPSACSASR